MKKILIIPADSIGNNISRSYFFGKYLSEDNSVFLLRWYDPQSLYFDQNKISKYHTLKCFFKSLFQLYKVKNSDLNNLNYLYCSRLTFMVIYRVIGLTNALKLSRFYNNFILKRVVKKINPNVILYADGYDSQPILKGDWVNLADVQDDFDLTNFRNSNYNLEYCKKNFSESDFNFIVSRTAKRRLEKMYNVDFKYLPNGVELEDMFSYNKTKYEIEKKLMGEKLIVSYIGGDAWVDNNFLKNLLTKCIKELPNVHFFIVGNLTKYDFPNATFTGGVDKEIVKVYYHLSDIGIMLKNSEGSDFLINSIPLKIFQYSVLGKRFFSPKISFLNEENFKNITIIDDYSPEEIIIELKKIMTQPNKIIEKKWDNYDWRQIINLMSNHF